MWKRKHEFRPDKTGSGWLAQLYITRQQRARLLRWGLYCAALVLLSLLQDVIFCRVRIYGATTDLVAAGIFLLCMMLPTDSAAIFTLLAAVIYYFSGSAAGPYSILFVTGLGILINILRSSYLRKSFSAAWLSAGVAVLAYELLVFVTGIFLGHTHLSRLPGFMITAGLTVAVMPVLYPVFLRIDRIGGESWKE